MTEKKKSRTSKEIGIEILENEKIYNKLVEEDKKILELKGREYDHLVKTASERLDKTKQQIILEAGRMLEKFGLVKPHKISAKLKRDFKGYIHRATVYQYAPSHWLDIKYIRNPTGKNRANISSMKGLTEQEKQYIEAFEREVIRDKKIAELVYEFTNIDTAGQGRIIRETAKGSDWRKRFADKAADYMLQVSKQMTDSTVSATLSDLRTLKYIADRFGDVLYEELEVRKKKGELFKE